MSAVIKLRRGTTQEWSTSTKVLQVGEVGIDITLNKIKAGDGINVWSNLPWIHKLPSEDVSTAVEWTANHAQLPGGVNTRYLAGDVVWSNGNLYVANYDNESLPVSNTQYWSLLGPGNRLNIDGRDIPNIEYSQINSTPDLSVYATSDYVDQAVSSLGNTVDNTYVPISEVGNPDGIATLDSNGQVPASQLGNASSGSWSYIGSMSSTSGSTVLFSNLNGQYKELLLTFHGVGATTSDLVQFRINGDSNNSSYDMASAYSYGGNTYYGNPIFNGGIPTLISFDLSSGSLRITNANTSGQKGVTLTFRGRVSNWITSSYVPNAIESLAGAYTASSAVNSLSISMASGTFWSGSWKLWGFN